MALTKVKTENNVDYNNIDCNYDDDDDDENNYNDYDYNGNNYGYSKYQSGILNEDGDNMEEGRIVVQCFSIFLEVETCFVLFVFLDYFRGC